MNQVLMTMPVTAVHVVRGQTGLAFISYTKHPQFVRETSAGGIFRT